MVRLIALLSAVFLLGALAVTLVPDPWSKADQKSAQDADRLAGLTGSPDRISWHLTSDAALLRAMIWDSDGARRYPPPPGMTPVPYKFSDEAERKLATFQTSTEVVKWRSFDVTGRELLACHAKPAVCLIYDRVLLEDVLSLRDGALTQKASKTRLVALLVAVSFLLAGSAMWLGGRSREQTLGFKIIRERHIAIRDTLEVSLTPRDLKLLSVLEERDGAVVTKDELYDTGWGRDYMPNSRSLDQHIINLRRKLDPDKTRPVLIETVHGFGYRLLN